jgi:hypothetical protein
MNFDKTVYAGSTYSLQATAVMDTADWRVVSYILTWYNPPADSGAAAANQVAIWKTTKQHERIRLLQGAVAFSNP